MYHVKDLNTKTYFWILHLKKFIYKHLNFIWVIQYESLKKRFFFKKLY